jgi:hypothetical protein
MGRIKLLFLAFLAPLMLAGAAQPAAAFDLFPKSVCQGPAAASPTCKQNTTGNPVIRVIRDAATILALITGAAAVIMIIIGGITLSTSSGNAEAIASARKRIIYSLIGLVVVALAWAIVSFVTDRLIK